MLSLVTSRVLGTLRMRAAAPVRVRLPAGLPALRDRRGAAAAAGLGACVGAGLAAALHDAPQCAAVPEVTPMEDGSVQLDQAEKEYAEAADAGVASDGALTRENEARVIPLLARIGKLFAIKKAALTKV